ncbi:trehalose-6-phosphate synthase [Candidatus Roizmanbacteria bacterium]|nr:trehalose-6-phosphate synthase [Candidatus Roizmanbacteria bacterium]
MRPEVDMMITEAPIRKIDITRAPPVNINGNGEPTLGAGGVEIALASLSIEDALQNGNGSPNATIALNGMKETKPPYWEQHSFDMQDVQGLDVDAEIQHELLKNNIGKEKYEQFRRFSVVLWWIHHGMEDKLDIDVRELGLDKTFYEDYAGYRRANTSTAFFGAYKWDNSANPEIQQEPAIAPEFIEKLRAAETITIHDGYYLARVAHILRNSNEIQYQGDIVLVNHIPFPRPEHFQMLRKVVPNHDVEASIDGTKLEEAKWRRVARTYLQGWLAADRISFHTQKDADNFRDCIAEYLQDVIDCGTETMPDLIVNPLGTDIDSVERVASETTEGDKQRLLEKVVKYAEYLDDPSQLNGLMIGVDIGTRSDPIKRIPQKFEFIEYALDHGTDEERAALIGNLTIVQQVRPHRLDDYASYAHEMKQIRETAQRINAKYAYKGWQPIILVEEGLPHQDVLGIHKALAEKAYRYFSYILSREGMSLCAQEALVAAGRPDTASIISTDCGFGETLAKYGCTTPIHGTPTSEAVKDRILYIASASDEQLRQDYCQTEAVLQDIQLSKWANKLMHTINGYH